MKSPDYVMDIFLQPGEIYFGDHETRIRTLLGSCVAITLWHPRYLIGGMCHYVLPEKRQMHENEALDGRYADEALLIFLKEISKAATKPSDYIVKMFGGGNQFPNNPRPSNLSVPNKNIQAGKELLKQHGFTLKSAHVGGNGHRYVMLDIWSGQVWIQHTNV